ncbi:MAG: DNA polymerase III subunit delta [Alloprevotella sp.]|nr:MAG: DNA polymerase III subunit delta [Alloprevotella sp.]
MLPIAQTSVVAHLRKLYADNRIPHALLLAGPEGCGKMAIALDFARLLLCETPQHDETDGQVQPCGHCHGCAMSRTLAHPDLHFVFPTIKSTSSTRSVSDMWLKEWREMLLATPYFDLAMWEERMGIANQQPQIFADESEAILRKVSLVSAQGGYKIVIIWLPELMNEACANKMLKLLEEPPQQTLFLLCSNQPERIITTIRSRTQRIDVKVIPEADIATALERERGLSTPDAARIAHIAAGSYTRALRQISVSNEEREFLDMFILLMRKCYLRDIKEMHAWSEQLSSWGRERQKAFLEYAQRLVRENFVYNFRLPQLNYLTQEEEAFSTNFARFINERNVIGISEELALAQRDIMQNVNPRMVFFDFALKMIVLLIQ